MEDAIATAGTSQDSTITFTATRTTASASLETVESSGSFTTSTNDQKASFTITTNNYTGYELKIKSSTNNTLTDSSSSEPSTISPITNSTGIASNEFTNNTWGYIPNYYNSIENSTNKYYPITTSDVTLRKTTSANVNNTPDTYTIGIGIKADYDTPAGTYTNNNLVLTYVANPVTYAITYDKGNTTDTVANLPTTQAGEVSASSVTLSSTTPTRTGYDFTGWCLGAISTNSTTKVDSCVNDTANNITAKTFQSGGSFGIDQTIMNNAALHAMWSMKTVTITVQDGGNTTVTGSGTYKYGDVITVTATTGTNTSCTTYSTPTWTAKQTADTSQDGTGTLSSTSGTSITYTVGLTNDTLTATSTKTTSSANQTITLSRGTGASGIKIDGKNYTSSSVSLSCGNHTIDGTYNSGYDFNSWSRSNGVAFDSASGTSSFTPAGTITVTGNGTLTLSTKTCTAISGNMQSFNPSTSICSWGTLTDSRDSKTYTVRKINDQWWMTQNLRFTGTSLSTTTSNVTSNKTLTYYSLDKTDSSYTGHCDSTNGYNYACTKEDGNSTVGVFYNYYAATAGTINGSSNSATTTQDICPKGWHLPTGPNTTSNTDFNKLVGNKTSGLQDPTTGLTAFGAFPQIYYNNGSASAAYGYLWSATSNSATRRYALSRYNSSSNKVVNGASYISRNYGVYVRCVRSS